MSSLLRYSLVILSIACYSTAWAADHRLGRGESLTLDADLVLSGEDTLEWVGSAEKPITITGGGHQIRTADNWRGKLSIAFATLKGLGTDSIKPEFYAIHVQAGGDAVVSIENCLFDASAGVVVANNGNSTTSFSRNTVLANALVPVRKDLGDSREAFWGRGNSPAPKSFQGNRIFKGHCVFESPKWLVGGDTDAESNLLIGHRIKIQARGNTSVIRGNYLHILMPRNAEFPYWSQVSTVDPGGALLEHNVIRDGEWIVQFTEGEVRYNVICDINDHNLMRNGSLGKVHHNIFHVGKPEHPPGAMSGFIFIVYPPKNPGQGMEIYSNTFDGCGTFEPPGVEVCEKGFVTSLRNNAFVNMRLTKYFTLPNSVVRPRWDEKEAVEPERLGYADYNLFHNPDAKLPRNYTLSVAGKTKRKDAGFGLHDVPSGGAVDAQADPKFAGPTLKVFPFEDADIVAGKVTVSQMLARFREAYTPAAGSPLIDAGDPADGAGTDIGAVGAGKADAADRFGKWGKGKGY